MLIPPFESIIRAEARRRIGASTEATFAVFRSLPALPAALEADAAS